MVSVNKVTLLNQLQDTVTRIKQYILQQISNLAPLDSPNLTGTPTAPTPTDSGGATQIANKGYVDARTEERKVAYFDFSVLPTDQTFRVWTVTTEATLTQIAEAYAAGRSPVARISSAIFQTARLFLPVTCIDTGNGTVEFSDFLHLTGLGGSNQAVCALFWDGDSWEFGFSMDGGYASVQYAEQLDIKITELYANKLDKNPGTDFAGKVLAADQNGEIIPITLSAGDVGAVEVEPGSQYSDQVLVVDNDGFVKPKTIAAQDVGALPDTTQYAGAATQGGAANKAVSIPTGHLDSTSTATVMTAQVDGITELRDGVCVWLRNGVVTSASGVTLNINSLGAKPLYSSLAAESRSTTIFNINYTLLLVYNATRVEGGCWDVVYGIDSNTTYSPYSLGFGYGICTTAAATAAKVASVSSSYKLVAGGIVAIKFNDSVPAGATLNINSKGAKAIYYKGAAITAGVIQAGDTVTFVYSTYYHVLSIDRWGTDLSSKYEKPTGGIPKTDLASDVQTSLDKAGTALQASSLKTINGNSLVGSGDIPISGGDSLPEVTSEDDGKVLMVVDGAWAAGSIPSATGVGF